MVNFSVAFTVFVTLDDNYLYYINKLVSEVQNKSGQKISYNLIVDSAKTVVTIPAHGIQTLVY